MPSFQPVRSIRLVRGQRALAAAVAFASLSPVAHAALETWTSAVGGTWSQPANWSPDVPTNTDDALFDLAGAFTVNLTGDESVLNLIHRQGSATIDLATHHLGIAQDLTLADTTTAASMTFSGGI